MKVYEDRTVKEASLDRIGWLIDEFDEFVVNYSGGKDSTVILDLVKTVAREKGELPVKVLWIDQEAEWKGTLEMMKHVMYQDEVDPYWLQVPFLIGSGASEDQRFMKAWDPEAEEDWMREKDPISIKENKYDEDRFHPLFEAASEVEFGGGETLTVHISGVRAEESPTRFSGLTLNETYKGRTWGRSREKRKGIYTLHPIYDWTYRDVWKYIYDNDLKYNNVYDKQFRKGKDIRMMRVSSIQHVLALRSAKDVQEFEPETYNKLVNRLEGIHSFTQISDSYFPDELPPMFSDWREYRNFLLDKMIDKEKYKQGFLEMFCRHDLELEDKEDVYEDVLKRHCRAILMCDWDGSKILNSVDMVECGPEETKIRKVKEDYLKEQGVDIPYL